MYGKWMVFADSLLKMLVGASILGGDDSSKHISNHLDVSVLQHVIR